MQINLNPDTCTGSERCCCSEAVPKVQEETLRLFCVSQEKWQHTENLLIAQTSAPWRGPEEHAQIKSHGLTGSERCCIVEINARRNSKTLCAPQEKWQHTENLLIAQTSAPWRGPEEHAQINCVKGNRTETRFETLLNENTSIC